jgi:hypothetical protein
MPSFKKHHVVLVVDGIHFAIHIEDAALVHLERLHDVLVRMRVDGFLVALAQEVHAALRARDVLVDRKHDVVGRDGVCGREEAEHGLEMPCARRR